MLGGIGFHKCDHENMQCPRVSRRKWALGPTTSSTRIHSSKTSIRLLRLCIYSLFRFAVFVEQALKTTPDVSTLHQRLSSARVLSKALVSGICTWKTYLEDVPNHSQQRTMRISGALYTAKYGVSSTTNACACMASKPYSETSRIPLIHAIRLTLVIVDERTSYSGVVKVVWGLYGRRSAVTRPVRWAMRNACASSSPLSANQLGIY